MTEREKQVTNGAMEAVNILLETRGPRCGVQLKDDALVLTPDEIKKLEESGVLRPVSEAEWSRFVLRALISYHFLFREIVDDVPEHLFQDFQLTLGTGADGLDQGFF